MLAGKTEAKLEGEDGMAPYREVITAPAAWTNRSIGGKAGLTQRLTAAQLAAFDAALARTRHLQPQETTREDFAHPEISALVAGLDETIRRGRGAVLLSGLTRATHSEEDMERIYWGIGVRLGDPAVQSMLGDRLGHVQHVKDDPVARGYRSNEELTPHTDSYRVVGLMCLQRAETGGLSRIVSSLAIHNEILATRPDLLEPLYEGYHYAVAEAQFSSKPVTDFKIPVFCNVDGVVSCNFVRDFMRRAAKLRGETFPKKLAEAIEYMSEVAERDDIGIQFLLEPGEMLLWHNFQMLHAREAYRDSPEHTRHLLRLWLKIDNDRPICDEILARAKIYERVHQERSGRVPESLVAAG
ncbi:MAG TPA: TauD/TfdA family dioxygenase [Acetobacteraceae bacterium]|nr:TauD/TfdA family dioxygenase [Acetobacteraceae bacterium]